MGIVRKAVLLLLHVLATTKVMQAHQVTVVGCGYVGLTLTGMLLENGHQVVCVEKDRAKVAQLLEQKLYIYEPHLDELLFKSENRERVSFVNSIYDVSDSDIYYLCVATPVSASGKCDTTFLIDAFHEVAAYCALTDTQKIVCVKSTVPPGTVRGLQQYLDAIGQTNITLIYNPEFMREGCALRDIYSNPVVLGGDSPEAMARIRDLYDGFLSEDVPVIETTFESAEVIKYSWNAFSAIRIAYVNELAILCREVDADIRTVVKGFSLSEELLPTSVLKPGPGFGGSCLPKDATSFAYLLDHCGFISSMVHQALNSNKQHIKRVISDIKGLLGGDLSGKTVALLGLSFKANTNDIRNAPSLEIIKELIAAEVQVQAFDPHAMDAVRMLFPSIEYYASPYQAVAGADCIVVLTEWNEIKHIDLGQVAELCNQKLFIDTRNIIDIHELKRLGFEYLNMGAS